MNNPLRSLYRPRPVRWTRTHAYPARSAARRDRREGPSQIPCAPPLAASHPGVTVHESQSEASCLGRWLKSHRGAPRGRECRTLSDLSDCRTVGPPRALFSKILYNCMSDDDYR